MGKKTKYSIIPPQILNMDFYPNGTVYSKYIENSDD